jgi:Phage integrase SAM-like domain
MSTINFYLGKKDKNDQYPVILVYQSGGLKFKYSTKVKTRKNGWKKQRLTAAPGEEIKALECNSRLDSLSRMIRSTELEIIQNGLGMTLDNVQAIFRKKALEETAKTLISNSKVSVIKAGDEERSNFFTELNKFIEGSRLTHRPNSVKSFINTKNRLLDFQQKRFGLITFEKIDTSFYKQLVAFLIHDCGFLNNTTGKNIKNIKTFINYLKGESYELPVINLTKFKVFRETVDNISLTEAEVD